MIARAAAGLVIAIVGGCGFPVKVGELDALDEGTSVGTEPASTGAVSSSSSSSESGDPPPPTMRHDFAILLGDVPQIEPTDGGASGQGGSSTDGGSSDAGGSTGGDPFGPDALLVIATTGAGTCEDPFGDGECDGSWRASLNLAPDLQVLGAAGLLEDVNGSLSITGLPDVEGVCSGGGGTLFGRYEVTAIDDTRISVQLTELDPSSEPFVTELRIDAPRCP